MIDERKGRDGIENVFSNENSDFDFSEKYINAKCLKSDLTYVIYLFRSIDQASIKFLLLTINKAKLVAFVLKKCCSIFMMK